MKFSLGEGIENLSERACSQALMNEIIHSDLVFLSCFVAGIFERSICEASLRHNNLFKSNSQEDSSRFGSLHVSPIRVDNLQVFSGKFLSKYF